MFTHYFKHNVYTKFIRYSVNNLQEGFIKYWTVQFAAFKMPTKTLNMKLNQSNTQILIALIKTEITGQQMSVLRDDFEHK